MPSRAWVKYLVTGGSSRLGRCVIDGVGEVRARSVADCGPGGVPADFTGVYERFFADIHRYIAGRLGRDVADDIAADTFVIALRKHGSFDAGRRRSSVATVMAAAVAIPAAMSRARCMPSAKAVCAWAATAPPRWVATATDDRARLACAAGRWAGWRRLW